jgi:hypothetical protein
MPLTRTPLSLRHVQIVWGVAMAFAIFCIIFGGLTRKTFEGSLNWLHGALFALAVWSAWGGISTRRKLINRASVKSNSDNALSSGKTWTAAQMLGIMSAEAIVLWALVSNIVVASPWWFSDAIYVTGILLLFKFMPTKPAYSTS